MERAYGRLDLGFRRRGGCSRLAHLYQDGCLKARFPRQIDPGFKSGVLINTTGGIADGDQLKTSVGVEPETSVTLTTQAAERVYKASGLRVPASVDTALNIAEDACLYWLPQETILFDGSAAVRNYTVDIAARGRCLIAEMTVLGRIAHGEVVRHLSFFDRWRIRHAGKLVFADGFRLERDVSDAREARARLQGAQAMATIFYVGPDAENHRDALRGQVVSESCHMGCSLKGELLVARMAAPSPTEVRTCLMQAISLLDGARGMAAPVLSRWIF